MKNRVFWDDGKYQPGIKLRRTIQTKFLIVGAGITGLSIAYYLRRARVPASDIVIIEKETIGSGSTGRSAGQLVPETETEGKHWWNDFEERFKAELTQTYLKAHEEARVDLWDLIETENLKADAELQDFFIFARGQAKTQEIVDDTASRTALGEHPHLYTKDGMRRKFGTLPFELVERVVSGIGANPLKLARSFAGYLRRDGIRIYENTPLKKFHGTHAHAGKNLIKYETIILAHGLSDTEPALHSYVSTIGVTKPIPRFLREKLHLEPHIMFVDNETEESYHYGRMTHDNRLLVGYGDARIKTKNPKHHTIGSHVRSIKSFIEQTFPEGRLSLEYAWSGVYALHTGYFPLVKHEGNVWHVNGAGMQTSSMVIAKYTAQKLVGKDHPLDGVFSRT